MHDSQTTRQPCPTQVDEDMRVNQLVDYGETVFAAALASSRVSYFSKNGFSTALIPLVGAIAARPGIQDEPRQRVPTRRWGAGVYPAPVAPGALPECGAATENIDRQGKLRGLIFAAEKNSNGAANEPNQNAPGDSDAATAAPDNDDVFSSDSSSDSGASQDGVDRVLGRGIDPGAPAMVAPTGCLHSAAAHVSPPQGKCPPAGRGRDKCTYPPPTTVRAQRLNLCQREARIAAPTLPRASPIGLLLAVHAKLRAQPMAEPPSCRRCATTSPPWTMEAQFVSVRDAGAAAVRALRDGILALRQVLAAGVMGLRINSSVMTSLHFAITLARVERAGFGAERARAMAAHITFLTIYPAILSAQVQLHRILRVFLPAVANLLLMPLVGAVDLFWVGQTGDALAIAGMGAANQVYTTIYFLSSFLPALVTPKIAMAASQDGGNSLEGSRFVREALAFAGAIGLIGRMHGAGRLPDASVGGDLIRSCCVGHRTNFAVAGPLPGPNDVVDHRVRHVPRAPRHEETPLKVTLLANALNVLLDPILMFGVGLGAAGAAAATSASEVLGVLLFLLLLRRRGYLDGPPSFPSQKRLRSLMGNGLAVQARSLGVQIMFIAAVRRVTSMDPSGLDCRPLPIR
ncbi:unnamed protein product [Prorocentrum cordatum]|uniref:Protein DETOXIFICATION n=1 Tax=Prorocentrum cordatum TaxID=2364126 RepID=A0ABN9RTW2_9DINO|nr:unnamed protein product [Polarella glacialis]